jgi:hypothetical protein
MSNTSKDVDYDIILTGYDDGPYDTNAREVYALIKTMGGVSGLARLDDYKGILTVWWDSENDLTQIHVVDEAWYRVNGEASVVHRLADGRVVESKYWWPEVEVWPISDTFEPELT